MSWVRVSLSPDVHICCGAHRADTVIPSLIYCQIAQGVVQTSGHHHPATHIVYDLFTLIHCANFIFSQFAPIAITAWGRVMWTAISELLCCYWSGPGRETIGDHPTSPHQLVTDQGWEELKRVRKRNKSNINACPALNSSFLNILMGGFSTIQTDLSQNNLQINYQHHPFDKIFKMPSCWKTVLRKPTVLPASAVPIHLKHFRLGFILSNVSSSMFSSEMRVCVIKCSV